uniref:VQ domain-containing protein n=1 Tax=Fagus sylvatica TaxID=28930 RepID=A0A2N9F5L4_FAGSY
MSGGYREPVKVVIINTHYVETDARSFKSVVQKLTGKDSTVAAAKESESKVLRERMERMVGTQSGVQTSSGRAFVMRDLSFKGFEGS